jgi:hypothetical protein
MRCSFGALLVCAVATGCSLASKSPNPDWLADFRRAHSIRVQIKDSEITIADHEAVQRLGRIYADATWKPYRATLPGNLYERELYLIGDDGTYFRRFCYTGGLWEAESYTENRTTSLTAADRQWIESLFAMVPESDAPTVANESK